MMLFGRNMTSALKLLPLLTRSRRQGVVWNCQQLKKSYMDLENQREQSSEQESSETKTSESPDQRLRQGDMIRDVEYLESMVEEEGILTIKKIQYPLVVVLTQDCDLSQEFQFRYAEKQTQDKWLISVLVAPVYNAEHVFSGEHLSKLGLQMQQIRSSTEGRLLKQNRLPRYHFLEFSEGIPIVPSVIDFKHYFSVNVEYLQSLRRSNYVCTVSALHREHISQRFASFLSRIGLPNPIADCTAA